MSANFCSSCNGILNVNTPIPLDKPHLCNKCLDAHRLKERAPELLRALKDVMVHVRSLPGVPPNSFYRALQVVKRADPDSVLVEVGKRVWEWRRTQ